MLLSLVDLSLVLLMQNPGPFVDASVAVGIAENTFSFSIAAADLDADCKTDLVISRHGARPRLWKNLGGRFVDRAPSYGFLADDCHGVTIADLEPDYFPEIFVSVGACRGTCHKVNHYYLNHFGTFYYGAGSIFDDPNGRGRSMTPFDLNGDRRLDPLIVNFNDGPNSRTRYLRFDPTQPARYVDMAPANGIDRLLSSSVSVLDLNDDGRKYALFDGPGNDAGRAYEVDSLGQFTEVTSRLGLQLTHRWTIQQIVPFDYDSDRDLDLYVVRAAGQRDALEVRGKELRFRTQRSDSAFRIVDPGPFEIDVRINGVADSSRIFYGSTKRALADGLGSAALGALRGTPQINAGDRGVFVWHDQGELHLRAVLASSEVTALIKLTNPGPYSISGLTNLPRYSNQLLRNDAGVFVDVTASAGLIEAADSGTAIAEDFDADGDLDLFVVNRGTDFDNEPDALYLNQDDGSFVEAAAQVGLRGASYGRGDGATAFDHDLDGDLDLFVTNGFGSWPNLMGPVQCLRNDSNRANGASLQIIGLPPNTFAIGARIYVLRKDGRIQYRVRGGITAHMSHGLAPFFIGVSGPAPTLVEVLYPSGVRRQVALSGGTNRIVFE